jgi:hypothetical protein
MRSNNKIKFAFLLLATSLFSLPVFGIVSAEGENNSCFGEVAKIQLPDKDLKDGTLIALAGKDIQQSSSPYQNVILGTICNKPSYSGKPSSDLGSGSGGNEYEVVVAGYSLVTVNTKNGNIKKGDQITSSNDKGVGMKAVKSGYVLGTALEDYSSGNKDETKTIKVSVSVHYYDTGNSIKTNIADVFKLAALAAYEQPKLALKYIASAVVVVATIIFSFVSVGKVARLGIIALGRNPLAAGKIYKGILVNTLSSLAIIISGLVAAYFMATF